MEQYIAVYQIDKTELQLRLDYTNEPLEKTRLTDALN